MSGATRQRKSVRTEANREVSTQACGSPFCRGLGAGGAGRRAVRWSGGRHAGGTDGGTGHGGRASRGGRRARRGRGPADAVAFCPTGARVFLRRGLASSTEWSLRTLSKTVLTVLYIKLAFYHSQPRLMLRPPLGLPARDVPHFPKLQGFQDFAERDLRFVPPVARNPVPHACKRQRHGGFRSVLRGLQQLSVDAWHTKPAASATEDACTAARRSRGRR